MNEVKLDTLELAFINPRISKETDTSVWWAFCQYESSQILRLFLIKSRGLYAVAIGKSLWDSAMARSPFAVVVQLRVNSSSDGIGCCISFGLLSSCTEFNAVGRVFVDK